MLENYRGMIEVNGQTVDRLSLTTLAKSGKTVSIKLTPYNFIKQFHKNDNPQVKSEDEKEYEITVKPWMTRKSDGDFDFMLKWNNDIPMPLRTMVGKKTKETKGMEYWELHGQGKPVITCMRCGKELTNPVSRKYGVGPECIHKIGIVLDIDDVDGIKEKLVNLTWSGWMTKSAILKCEEV